MRKCPECKTECANNATRCPKCGHRFMQWGAVIGIALFVVWMIQALARHQI